MLLQTGHWLGRGSLLAEGSSRGQPITCELDVTQDDDGFTLGGHWQTEGAHAQDFSLRVAPNDVGTFTLGMRLAGVGLQGSAKLSSVPNLGLMWNDAGTVHATFALFAVSGGCGFRGFVRDGERLYTWEVAFTLSRQPLKGDNVVSLHRRRR